MVKMIYNDIKGIFVQLKDCVLGLFVPSRTESEIKSEPKIEHNPDDEPTEVVSFSLEPVKEFLEDFIGIAIIGFKKYHDQIPDLNLQIQKKIIAGVIIKDQAIWIKLSNFNGIDGGYLKIQPSIVGEFASIGSEDEVMDRTLYRLNFFGGSCLEYLDHKLENAITYQEQIA